MNVITHSSWLYFPSLGSYLTHFVLKILSKSVFIASWKIPFCNFPMLCWKIAIWSLPRRPEVFNSPRQILTLLNKVPGYWLQGETDLANKPRILQIFPHSKFGINRTAGLKVMAKKIKFRLRNFLAITFKTVVRLIPNFECGKICKILGLFAKSVTPWSQ